MSEYVKLLPRGLRNNNPLNLRKGEYWRGLASVQNDPEFCQFKTMAWGVRAAFACLRTYIVVRHLNTIRLIVSRWAPSSENNTEAYIKNVVLWSGIPENKVISFYDREIMFALFSAMCRMENGQGLSRSIIAAGYALV